MSTLDRTQTYKLFAARRTHGRGCSSPVALVGAELPSGVTVDTANIRGEPSHGMLCSESELNISDDASGLMELPDNLKAGTPLVEALGLDDVMMELEITPNRRGLPEYDRCCTGN